MLAPLCISPRQAQQKKVQTFSVRVRGHLCSPSGRGCYSWSRAHFYLSDRGLKVPGVLLSIKLGPWRWDLPGLLSPDPTPSLDTIQQLGWCCKVEFSLPGRSWPVKVHLCPPDTFRISTCLSCAQWHQAYVLREGNLCPLTILCCFLARVRHMLKGMGHSIQVSEHSTNENGWVHANDLKCLFLSTWNAK